MPDWLGGFTVGSTIEGSILAQAAYEGFVIVGVVAVFAAFNAVVSHHELVQAIPPRVPRARADRRRRDRVRTRHDRGDPRRPRGRPGAHRRASGAARATGAPDRAGARERARAFGDPRRVDGLARVRARRGDGTRSASPGGAAGWACSRWRARSSRSIGRRIRDCRRAGGRWRRRDGPRRGARVPRFDTRAVPAPPAHGRRRRGDARGDRRARPARARVDRRRRQPRLDREPAALARVPPASRLVAAAAVRPVRRRDRVCSGDRGDQRPRRSPKHAMAGQP